MCGIVGYTGNKPALDILISGLEKLEYRGYDSAGVALNLNHQITLERAVGRLVNLKNNTNLKSELQGSTCGIGHTRWATHGGPSEINAHPHLSEGLALVHNGIIENYQVLRKNLEVEGYKFNSETDTEVAAHLLHKYLIKENNSPEVALAKLMDKVEGSFAFVATCDRAPEQLLVARRASPLIVGLGEQEFYIASDVTAILEYTRQVIYLEDNDYAVLDQSQIAIYNNGENVKRDIATIKWDLTQAQRGGYSHFMIKEIFDQPKAVNDTLSGRLVASHADFNLLEIAEHIPQIKNLNRIKIVACGTAWHAAQVGKHYFERIARIPCDVEVASEFRYQEPIFQDNDLLICVSQSGETADTLAAIDLIGSQCLTLGITNVLGSSLSRKVKASMLTQAGPEISVASTKAFITQALVMYLLALKFAKVRNKITPEELEKQLSEITLLSSTIHEILQANSKIEGLADKYLDYKNYFFLGRGVAFPIALEGALKLKEVTYHSAQGYPAGELKHGPIALIDPSVVTVAVVQKEEPYFSKTLSNLSEVKARKGKIIVVSDAIEREEELRAVADDLVFVPFINNFITPILTTIPLQLYAYETARKLGREIDCPRNLAKSVTVE